MTQHRHDSSSSQVWTTRSLIQWTAQFLQRSQVDSPRLAAELLLAHVLSTTRIKLFMDMDRPANPIERAAYRQLVERAAKHEPIQYLTGEAFFFSLPFAVDPRVLIPRPSTEALVEHVIQFLKHTPGFAQPRIADVCTGSGCIAVALAIKLPDARIAATDISPDALDVAQKNAAAHHVVDRIDFFQGDLLTPLVGERFAVIAANPPYISDAEWAEVAPNVRDYEPESALRSGPDGLDALRRLIAAAPDLLLPGGRIVFEMSSSQGKAAVEIAQQTPGLVRPRILADFEGHDRLLVAEREHA